MGDALGPRTQCEANAEFTLLLPDAIGDYAIDADDAKRETDRSEHREEQGQQPRPTQRAGDKLRERLEQKLGIRYGQTTTDDRFTLLPIPCLGTCDRAPAMLIGDDLHRDLEDATKVDAILERYS